MMEIRKLILENRKSQIWVETVIYTLIALVLITTVLAFARPKIQELQDKAIIEQSVQIMKDIDLKISEVVSTGSGNKRVLEIGLNKGAIKLDAVNDKIIFELETPYQYSEYGKLIPEGRGIISKTEQNSDVNVVTIFKEYGDLRNLTISGAEEIKTIDATSGAYSFSILNSGSFENRTIIELRIDS